MDELHKATIHRENDIRKTHNVVSIWECTFDSLLKHDVHARDYVSTLDIPARLRIRDSFFGGRVNATRLHYKAEEGEKIHYYDFTSLYPFVNKYKTLPTGHPEIITSNFDYTMTTYFGIAQVKILPPRGLYHPVLPYRSGGKLKFPLCRKCADNMCTSPCQCTIEERAITGTYCTPEIMKALEKGYTILKIYEVYHWKNSSNEIFKSYVNAFLRIKQENSGDPDWVQTEEDQENYIRLYKEAEGIDLRKDHIQHNPGLRTVSKLILNSMWGRFGMKGNLLRSKYVTDPVEFKRMVNSDTLDIALISIVGDDCVLVEHKSRATFEEDDLNTNEVVATFTTCWARLELYNLIDFLGHRVLYMDTDSVIFIAKENDPMPPLGDFLGQLTDEIPQGLWITEFISSGPKSYSYRLSDNSERIKFKGVMMNEANAKFVSFQSIQEVVTKGLVIRLPTYNLFVRDKINGQVFNKLTYKTVKLVYDKRVLLDNYDTLPYGY